MKEIKLYQCSVCGTQYSDKTNCRLCENSHKTELKIKKGQYVAFKNNKKGFPLRIVVEDMNGNTETYRLE